MNLFVEYKSGKMFFGFHTEGLPGEVLFRRYFRSIDTHQADGSFPAIFGNDDGISIIDTNNDELLGQ